MNIHHFMNIAAGFGILLFSLRYFTSLIERGNRATLSRYMVQLAPSNFRALLLGIGFTVLVQASSVTIICAMSLVTAGLLSLNRGIMMTLGATIGTTIKGLVLFGSLGQVSACFVFFGTLASFYWRLSPKRVLADSSIIIGITIFGLSLVKNSLGALGEDMLLSHLQHQEGSFGVGGVLLGIGSGALLSVMLQSSSAILMTSLDMVHNGSMLSPSAVSLILGANIGTTSTALLLSLSSSQNGKRIALAHVIVKVIGVSMCVLFFKTFMTISHLGAQLVPGLESRGADLVSTSNTLFNVINAGVWWLFLPLLVRLLEKLIPHQKESISPIVSSELQKVLIKLPEHAFKELRKELYRNLQVIRDLRMKLRHGRRDWRESLNETFKSRQDIVKMTLNRLLKAHRYDKVVNAQAIRLLNLLAEIEICYEIVARFAKQMDEFEDLSNDRSLILVNQFQEECDAALERLHEQLQSSEYGDESVVQQEADPRFQELEKRVFSSVGFLKQIQG
ncbi:Na/Pi symporter [Pseudobacteriovorax antillogorgiicola]|uniref:Na/Pi-cotransporter n=1 Tax=Pseudobacteriovorax antillogorgiicola TaxID=1513793 RepID=A0A1Y6C4R3_9BACT|nr:Na/Pi symporter [Pseudobacteriovorax antillogorgiicola]TCS51227.1 Na/Pi-cotransporter [Pseudobacteriovorax antillogorgiicola]SMF36928.1 Na/Pi-cotransporter [Pseudobacteriovorax antillogorgiicola]